MSFMPSFSQDARAHRDDDYNGPLRATERRSNNTLALDGNSNMTQIPESGYQTPRIAGSSTPLPQRQLVFPDPIAFRYLEEDPCVKVVQHRAELCGYELYLVEQWACSRKSATLVIATYTGNEKDSIVVGVLSVPADEGRWSNELRVYLKAAEEYHARPKETPLGELMVTNLSGFPSSLTVIPVPDGDFRKNRQSFIVNEDLKRLGCSGRSGLTLTEPTEATQSKFQQLYRTSDRVPFNQSVTELIKLCQVALYLFNQLDHEYIDGLLCDITEKAISNWWTEVGTEHYNYEPTDGILGPSTVAGLLGMLMGARNRLHWQGAPVSKDVFDIESTKRGISYFQKAQKLEKSRRLDQQTLFKLHTATTKAAAKEDWGVQKAIKSTVTEIGGKRGEIVIDMVSGKDKGGLADIETVDLDKFISLAYGERPKWLWHGKPRRTPLEHHYQEHDMVMTKSEAYTQASKRSHSLPVEDEVEARRKDELLPPDSLIPLRAVTSATDGPAERDALRRTVFKSVAGKMSDARSGLGRIKDAVGARGRGHGSRLSITTKDEFLENGNAGSGFGGSSIPPSPAAGINRTFTWKTKPEEYLSAFKRGDSDMLPGLVEESLEKPMSNIDSKATKYLTIDDRRSRDTEKLLDGIGADIRKELHRRAPSIVPSVIDEAETDIVCPNAEQLSAIRKIGFSRRRSCDIGELCVKRVLNENRWARRMSFGDAEDAILTWDEIVNIADDVEDIDEAHAQAVLAQHLAKYIAEIVYGIEPWVKKKIDLVEALDEKYGIKKNELHALYFLLNDARQRVQSNSDEMLGEERSGLTESVKEIEVLVARLDYEIDALTQKVQDVDDGIKNFERQVEEVERRADELKKQLETESWLHWLVRTLTGIGTGPNITRAAQ